MMITLLVTDDESDILDLLESQLSELDKNFQIISAKSGYEALNHIRDKKIDLLLTDIAMPDMDGYELYQRTKEIRPELPIIMMTGFGYDPNHTIIKTKKIGLEDVIFKPFDIDKLLTMIYQRLDR